LLLLHPGARQQHLTVKIRASGHGDLWVMAVGLNVLKDVQSKEGTADTSTRQVTADGFSTDLAPGVLAIWERRLQLKFPICYSS
jgi:hypothetical protein